MICRQNVLCGPRCRLGAKKVCAIGLLDLISTGRDCGLRHLLKAVVTTLFLGVLQPLRYYQKKIYVDRWGFNCKSALNFNKKFLSKIQKLISIFKTFTIKGIY